MNSNKYTDTNGIEKEIASTNETIGKSVPQFLPPLGLAIHFLHQLSLLHHNRLFLFQWFGLLVDGRGNEIGSVLDELEWHEGMRGKRLVIPQN